MKEKFNISDHIYRLLIGESFFAAFSRRVNKTPTENIPTAGVRIDPETNQFELMYNPSFFKELSERHIVGVLKHEFYHIILGHLTSRRPQGMLTKIDNIAMDLAINSYLSDGDLPNEAEPGPAMPSGEPMVGCFPGEGVFKELPPFMTYEWYLEKLNSMASAGHDFGDTDSLDDHEGFGASSSNNEAEKVSREIADQRLKKILSDACHEARSSPGGWGTVHADMRKKIVSSCKSSIDWRKVLRYFIKTSERADRRSTPRRINRRFPKIHPGKRIRRQSKIAVSIDQSGSVDDRMLSLFFAELNKLSELATFTIIPFDTHVDESLIYTWKKGERRKWERVMCGGTDFDPPTKYVNENGFDGHIILTDMMAPKPISSRCQRMWMTTEEYTSNPYFSTSERVIAIKR
jgi:predicted metal-dependent peptidase